LAPEFLSIVIVIKRSLKSIYHLKSFSSLHLASDLLSAHFVGVDKDSSWPYIREYLDISPSDTPFMDITSHLLPPMAEIGIVVRVVIGVWIWVIIWVVWIWITISTS
jgi:hypothetical protein